MTQTFDPAQGDAELESHSGAQIAHSLLRLWVAVRYRRNLVVAVMAASALLGGLYYATAPRLYSSKAQILVTQAGRDHLDTSITNDDSQRQNAMPTFENIIRSARVLEGALKTLAPGDCIDLAGSGRDLWVDRLQRNLTSKTIRSTNVLEVSYRSKDPQVAANVVQAVVQSYIDLMDCMHRGTAGEISRMLTKERDSLGEKLGRKQEELLEARRQFADMDVRSDGKTLHPMVQRAVAFNDALTTVQKLRVDQEALLAEVQRAAGNGEDLGQYLITVGDAVGRELLLNSLGLGNRDTYAQSSLEQNLLTARGDLQAAQQNLGPMHPEVQALVEKIRLIEQFLGTQQDRINQRVADLRKSQLGPWLVQMVQQKVEESRRREEMLKARFEEARTEAVNLTGQLAQIELLERDVKRLSDMDTALFNQIASLDLRQNGQEVRVTMTEPPAVATSPVSPRLSMVGLLVVAGGLGTSLALVTLLDALDDRFRSVEEMQGRLGLQPLTMIQRLDAPQRTGLQALVAHAAPTSVAGESFRTLRTAITLTYPDARQIVITSAEPGDGKTTVLANLAVCYAQADKRILLIDADMRRPGLTGLMAMRGPQGLSEVLRAEGEVGQAATAHIFPSGAKGLDILPSGPRPGDPAELLGSPRFSQLLAWAETRYDLVLVDSPPTLATTDTAIIGRLVDGVILVVQPAKNRRRLVTRVVERLAFLKIPVLGLVVNHAESGADHGYYGYQGYGYGYGYGGYGDGEDNAHEEQGPAPASTAGDGCVPFPNGTEQKLDEEEPQTLTVPRRVA